MPSSRTRKLCRKFGTLLGLLGFLLCFSLCGAALFKAIEGPNEQAVIIQLNIAKMSLISHAYDAAQDMKFEEFLESMNRSLDFYDRIAGDALKHGVEQGQVEPRWSFRGALFYCVTIFTTIGYGNVCPTTPMGRVTTIVYGLVAIPLFLVIIGKVGRYMAAGLNRCFSCYHRLLLCCCCARVPSPASLDDVRKPLMAKQSLSQVSKTSKSSKVPVGNVKVDPTVNVAASVSASSTEEELQAGPILAIVIAVAFMLTGTVMYLLWEPWTFLEAFYFVFISLSTIGFGDFVPTKPTFFMMSSVYLFIGLALISMVINVLINFYSSAVVRAHASLAGCCSICQKFRQ